MAKYKAYPEYKDSGVEWLGEVPSHWEILSAKRMFQSVRTPAYKSDEQLAASQKYGVIPQSLMMQLNDSKVMLALKGTESFRHVEANNFVISLRSFEGGIEYSQYTGCVSPAYTVLKNSKSISYGYYRYLLKCMPFIAALQSSTDSLRDGKSINYEQFSALSLPLFSVQEQNVIAVFLDHETAKIDNLIEKQQQLIELLKEKRQAVISHAVTKGLNPDVPMKDSGVELLGEIPEHWALWKFSHIAPILTCGVASTPTYVDAVEGMPFLSAQNVKFDKLHLDKYNFIAVDLHKQLTKNRRPLKGDLLVTRVGAGIGEACVIDTDMEFSIYVSLTHIRLNPVLAHNRFIMYFFNSSYCHFLNYQGTVTGGGVGNLNVQNVKDYKIALPCIEEQKRIVSHLDLINKQFDILTSKAELGIKLMQERRTALISAAVTGKIDVRDWVAPDTQNVEVPQEATA
ncbi:restriction endonuclease subunit S [Citrobacter portucalensis]|uniref:restriction endonuclease subunit S n=1 Tax=Citrobacter portucalensis TaxID=1639133 RepID=UPI00226B207E|nr:restriction endonuclease subunit S [Citrobacter portucalensis]MCX8987308.1 restriction endonuclease subunit S [Citrobacter portucalensis]